MTRPPDAPQDTDDDDHADDVAPRRLRTFRQSSDHPYLVLPEDRSSSDAADSTD